MSALKKTGGFKPPSSLIKKGYRPPPVVTKPVPKPPKPKKGEKV